MRCALLVTALLLASCGQQAPPRSASEIQPFFQLSDRTVGLMQKISVGAPAGEVQAEIHELLAAHAAARHQISASVARFSQSARPGKAGGLDPVTVAACLEGRTNGAPISDTKRVSMGRVDASDLRPTWVMAAADCALTAQNYLRYLSDTQTVDDVGLAVGALHSLVLAVFADLGVDEPLPAGVYRAQLENYRSANDIILSKLAADCSKQTREVRDGCVAFAVATSTQPKVEALIRALAERDHAG